MILSFFAGIIVLIIIIIVKSNKSGSDKSESNGSETGASRPVSQRPARPARVVETEEKRYGRKGEQTATKIIRSVLHQDDFLFTNVAVSYEGKMTELDNVIVNKYGVFIIEVKNYKGKLYGREEDYEWEKYKDDGYGNVFEKNVKNPIKQVKRQTYILAKHLDLCGARVWVDGYALLLQGNSPVKSDYILTGVNEIDSAIHRYGQTKLDYSEVENIRRILS